MAMYSDLNMYSPTSAEKVEELDEIYQSLGAILGTQKGSRFFRPEFGAELEEFLYEPMSETVAFQIYGAVIAAVQRYDSRVNLNYSQTQVVPDYDGLCYYVTVAFTVNGMGDQIFEYMGALNKIAA